ncbi:polysialyltransferase family glycosyltransferase [Roseivirga sp. E12]|uniref:polysialyltransferase family glycosyltransferase n=1 Tax=Roseivirga sp. E12 TaxID=2819237 RepID=UPI001ABCCFE7|nr:polysialyltransferase family glycosyltransferase [Roseivirga sp. E12]MBO3698368.1 hypothetical protein [Roseivirga sp. E12]
MSDKKHYLLIWPTIRKDWVKVFVDLKDDFQLTFLPSTFPKVPNFANDFKCCYWSEFDSAQDILKKLMPDGIIFMSIESGLSMALNHTAQKEGIKTYILQHGIFTNYRDYRTREKLWRKKDVVQMVKQEQSEKAFSSLSFIRNSLKGTDQIKLVLIALYTKLQQKKGAYWTAKYFPLKLKKASQYLCFSPFNATIHKEIEQVSDEQIKYIGSPELIPYLEVEENLMEEGFYLHIDQALAENSFGEETVSKVKMIEFYNKLNEFCLSKKAKLLIKLHPESYRSDWLPQHENITYLKEVENFNRIVQSAKGCFGFYSTMIIPAVYWRATVLFKIEYSGLQEAIDRIKGASILDFWSFKPGDIQLDEYQVENEVIKRQFILPEGISQNALRDLLNE